MGPAALPFRDVSVAVEGEILAEGPLEAQQRETHGGVVGLPVGLDALGGIFLVQVDVQRLVGPVVGDDVFPVEAYARVRDDRSVLTLGAAEVHLDLHSPSAVRGRPVHEFEAPAEEADGFGEFLFRPGDVAGSL